MTSSPPASSPSNAAGKTNSGAASNTRDTTVDIERLAEKVYKLMLADLSLGVRRVGRQG